MKSNEERVQSIVSKAKRYKAERKMTLSTAAIVFCAVIPSAVSPSVSPAIPFATMLNVFVISPV